MNKREKLKADLRELDRIDDDIISVQTALKEVETQGINSFYIGVKSYPAIVIDYKANDFVKTVLSNQLSHLKGRKSVLEIELGVDE